MAQNKNPTAIAYVSGENSGCGVRGTVKFYQNCDSVTVVAEISGLPESKTGFFAFHIHEGGDCCGGGFPDTGGHYNPCGKPHPMHAGDLPPLLSANGSAYLSTVTDRFKVNQVIGRTVVIHGDPDDFHTQPSGNAGTKIACGVIRKP